MWVLAFLGPLTPSGVGRHHARCGQILAAPGRAQMRLRPTGSLAPRPPARAPLRGRLCPARAEGQRLSPVYRPGASTAGGKQLRAGRQAAPGETGGAVARGLMRVGVLPTGPRTRLWAFPSHRHPNAAPARAPRMTDGRRVIFKLLWVTSFWPPSCSPLSEADSGFLLRSTPPGRGAGSWGAGLLCAECDGAEEGATLPAGRVQTPG